MGFTCRISPFITGEAWTCQGSGREPRGAGRSMAAVGSGQAPLCVRLGPGSGLGVGIRPAGRWRRQRLLSTEGTYFSGHRKDNIP